MLVGARTVLLSFIFLDFSVSFPSYEFLFLFFTSSESFTYIFDFIFLYFRFFSCYLVLFIFHFCFLPFNILIDQVDFFFIIGFGSKNFIQVHFLRF